MQVRIGFATMIRSLTVAPAAFLAVVLAALLAGAGAAEAQAGPPPSVRLDIHGDFGWYNTFGAGARVDIPIVRDGFLRSSSVKDDLSLSPGVELFSAYYVYHGFGVIPMVMLQWNIYFAQHFSFLVEAGIALLFGPSGWNRHYYDSFIAPTGQLGFRWHFSDSVALLVRVGWPAGAQIGVAFDL